jgi:hypothetical protein
VNKSNYEKLLLIEKEIQVYVLGMERKGKRLMDSPLRRSLFLKLLSDAEHLVLGNL